MNKIEIYLSMLEKDPNNEELWYIIGEEYIQHDQFSKGLEAFSVALKQDNPKIRKAVVQVLRNYLEVEGYEAISHEEDWDEQQDDLYDEDEEDEYDFEEDEEENPEIDTIEGNFERDSNSLQSKRLKLVGHKQKDNVIPIENHTSKRVTFSDVGGLDSLKETIEMKIIKPFVNPGLFSRFKKKSGGGILLYGPPGCGKTFIAKATAGEIKANFYPVHITEILDPYIGVSEQNLHNIFATARMNKPSVLFFDELDALGFKRSKSSSDSLRTLVDTMLTEMQSIESNTDKLLVMGATNMPWDVDEAFKRPGRFDKLVFVAPPDIEARKAIFQLKLNGKPIKGKIQYDVLAEKTHLYSGADIENVVEVATEIVLSEIMQTNVERPITMDDLLKAIHGTKPSTTDWLNTIKNYIKYANQSGVYSEAAKYIKENLK